MLNQKHTFALLYQDMRIDFVKYQATGNDFVMVNNFDRKYDNLSIEQVIKACDRRFGIGADGFILLNKHPNFDFEMIYFNSDGSMSFCGNGARAAIAFAKSKGLINNQAIFLAIDGIHHATIHHELISIQMQNVNGIEKIDHQTFVLNTGSPHYVKMVEDLNQYDIFDFGKSIRYSDQYVSTGINVNLIKQSSPNAIQILTYERGVEDETLSCGTGATACALATAFNNASLGKNELNVKVRGGELIVHFFQNELNSFTDIFLSGPAQSVFEGIVEL